MSEFPSFPKQPDYPEKEGLPSSFSIEDGEKVETIRFAPGQYGFSFGPREIRPDAKDWFYGGNEQSLRETRSLMLDLNSSEFQNVLTQFKGKTPDFEDPTQFIRALDSVTQKTVQSDMADERIGSISDMIRHGRAACCGKSLLAGLLVKQLLPLKVEQLNGEVGKIGDTLSFPFTHAWLRISGQDKTGNGRVILYDPMYKRYQFFSLNSGNHGEITGGNFNFDNYSMDAFPFNIIWAQGLKAKSTSGLKLVSDFADSTKTFFVEQDLNLSSQVSGEIGGSFATDGGVIKLYNGEVRGRRVPKGPSVRYPLRGVTVF